MERLDRLREGVRPGASGMAESRASEAGVVSTTGATGRAGRGCPPQRPPFCMAAMNSALLFVLPILESSSSMASTGESGVRTRRRT